MRLHASTGYEAPLQPLGTTLVFPCRDGFVPGTVTYTCGMDGFSTTDTCVLVFRKMNDKNELIGDMLMSIHVDDSLLSASDEDIAEEFIEQLDKTWTITTHGKVDHFWAAPSSITTTRRHPVG